MSALRRYEILLPLRFNSGQPVPPELVANTVLKLREHFGAEAFLITPERHSSAPSVMTINSTLP